MVFSLAFPVFLYALKSKRIFVKNSIRSQQESIVSLKRRTISSCCLRFAEGHDAADIIRRILREAFTHQSLPPHRRTQEGERYSGYNLSYQIRSDPTAFAESF